MDSKLLIAYLNEVPVSTDSELEGELDPHRFLLKLMIDVDNEVSNYANTHIDAKSIAAFHTLAPTRKSRKPAIKTASSNQSIFFIVVPR